MGPDDAVAEVGRCDFDGLSYEGGAGVEERSSSAGCLRRRPVNADNVGRQPDAGELDIPRL